MATPPAVATVPTGLPPHRPSPTHASRSQDAATTAISAMLVGGLFSDGWAHHNLAGLEGFFTPWHGALYASFALMAVWMIRLGWTRGSGLTIAVPSAYRPGLVGLGVFALGGLADMAWHLVLGVEEGLDALLSPSHLLLLTGSLLIVTSAVRSRWAAADTSSFVALSAVALSTALVAFFLLYVSEFVSASPTVPLVRMPEGDPDHNAAELPATAGLASFLVTTGLLAFPLLAAWRRDAPPPRGLGTAVVASVAFLSVAVVGGRAAVAGAVGATLGALLADLLLPAVDRFTSRRRPGLRLPVMAGVTFTIVWGGHMAALEYAVGVRWPPELWSGAIILTAMTAALMGLLASAPPPRSAPDVAHARPR